MAQRFFVLFNAFLPVARPAFYCPAFGEWAVKGEKALGLGRS